MVEVERKCGVCNRKIKISMRIKGSSQRGIPYRETDSNEGILFYSGWIKIWFCNSCWGDLIKFIKW